MRILAVNGSLRRASSNGALLRAVARVVPREVEVVLYDQLAQLPQFNPDLDEEGATPPEIVAELRGAFIECDAVVISSPEYAHGVPGALKNLLDWLVSTGELVGKPVALFNAAPVGGTYAQANLLETLRTMNWQIIDEACLTEPFVARKIKGELTEAAALEQLEAALAKLVEKAGEAALRRLS